MANTFLARAHSRSTAGASATYDFEMPPYTSHTARRSPRRVKPPPVAAPTSSPARSSPRRATNNNSSSSSSGCGPVRSAAGASTSSDRALLDMLRSTVACLREKRMDVEALGCLEQGLWLQRRMLGADNPQVRAALEELVLGLNALAMQFLTSSAAFDQCLALLRKAEAVTAPGNFSAKLAAPLQVLTLNNLGCCYRKLGKPRAALRYLQEAARIGGAIGDAASRAPATKATTVVVNLSVTHLNLCAIQSQLGRHELALEHAQAAIFHAQDELVRLEEGAGGRARRLDDGEREEKLVSLAVAYHNLAVELEFNGRGDASLQWFRKAVELAGRYRERNAALCASFQRALDDAKRKHGPSQPRPASSSGPGVKPQRPPSSRATGDVSYQATVASKCYRPLRPSASVASTASVAAAGASSRADRPFASTARAAASPGPNARRQRPMSASSASSRARRPVSNPLYGSSSTASFGGQSVRESEEPAIDRHWKKLERQYELEEGDRLDVPAPTHGKKPGGSPRRADPQRRRPQSASAASSRPRIVDKATVSHGQADDDDDDDDCGVFDDDAPSGEEGREEGRYVDRRAQRSPSSKRHQHGGRRHHEALNYSLSDSSCTSNSCGCDVETDSGEPGSGYAGEDEEPDLPRQRVSHMAYLRRMKKIAESIRDDMGRHSPSQRQDAKHGCGASPGASKAAEPSQQEAVGEAETPRSASMSKMRAKLERMRSDSLLSLLDQRGEGDEGGREAAPDARSALLDPHRHISDAQPHSPDERRPEHAPPSVDRPPRRLVGCSPLSASKPAVVLVEDARVFTTSAQVRDGERELARAAAARLIQRFGRGGACRQRLQRAKRVQEESAAACAIQRQVRRHRGRLVDGSEDGGGAGDERELLLLQQEEVRDMAAAVIQQLYRSRRKHQQGVTRTKGVGDRGHGIKSDRGSDMAARRLQSAARRFLARRRVQRAQARRLSRQYIERAHFAVALAHARRQEQRFLEELSAVKVQALVRGRQSRALTECALAGLHAAASRIQGSFREHRRASAQSASVAARSIAARVLQRSFRQLRGRCEREERQDVEHIAAGAIQRFWLQRRLHDGEAGDEQALEDEYFDDARLEQEEAAMCIQALSRGHLTRKSLQSLQSLSGSASAHSRSSLHGLSSSADAPRSSSRATCGNTSFLPRQARELFLQSLDERTAERLIREEDALVASAVDSGSERFDELLRDLEAAEGDVMGRVLADMRVVVVVQGEPAVAMPVVVRVAQLVEQQLGMGGGGEATRRLRDAAMRLLFALRGVLTGE